MHQIYDRESATGALRRLLDEHGAMFYTYDSAGNLILLGDGWTITIPKSELAGRLVDGWKLIRRGEYPQHREGQ